MVFQQEENNTGVRGCSPRMGSNHLGRGAKAFTVTPEINAFIEAAVKELDLAEKNAIGEIGKIFSDAE